MVKLIHFPEIYEDVIHSVPMNEKLMSLYEAGSCDEYALLTYYLRLCNHPQAKTLLPVPQMERLFTPLIMGKPGTPNAVSAILILATIVDSDKTRAFSYGEEAVNTIKYICRLVSLALSKDTKNRDDTWRLHIMLAGIANLAVNERNQAILGEAGIILLLLATLHAKPTDEWLYHATRDRLKESKKYAFQALMNLAFHPENVARFTARTPGDIRSPKEEIESLLGLAQQQISVVNEKTPEKQETARKESEEMVKSLQSILFILDEHNQKNEIIKPVTKTNDVSKPDTKETKEEPHIMISYQWDAQETVKKIVQRLKQLGHKVWLDIEQMQGSTLEAMAHAVERASVVLICVSQRYKDSPNCRLEGEYASNLRKKVVFLKVQNYKPDGWLGIMVGSQLWYGFYDEPRFEENFAAVSALLQQLAVPSPSAPTAPVATVAASSANSYISWTEADVSSWLQRNKLSEYAASFTKYGINGIALFELADWSTSERTSALAFFKKDLGVEKPGDMLCLLHALRKLGK